jgi:hypothetical protein
MAIGSEGSAFSALDNSNKWSTVPVAKLVPRQATFARIEMGAALLE